MGLRIQAAAAVREAAVALSTKLKIAANDHSVLRRAEEAIRARYKRDTQRRAAMLASDKVT